MPVEREGELELGADAVGARDQHGLAIALRQFDQRAEPANAGQHLRAQGAFGEGLDRFDQRFARIDVDAGPAIGQRRAGGVAWHRIESRQGAG